MLGGITLVSAYALGADALATPLASPTLIALGALQLVVGVLWLVRARALRSLVTGRPGTVAGTGLAGATAVAALGGSAPDTAWVTSAQCALIVVGALLPLRGLAVAAALSTLTAAALWIALDGPSGGYEGDGDYVVAVIALAKFLAAGLVLGYLTGNALRLLTRWHVIEVHERGLIGELRVRLDAVNRAATALAARIDPSIASQELRALKARLAQGVGLADAHADVRLGTVLDGIAQRWGDPKRGARLVIDAGPTVRDHPLDAVAADTLVTVLERQLDNVARHAPGATLVEARVRADAGHITAELVDDGGGARPTSTGTGTAWSERQLRRIGGSLAYFDGAAGTGLRVEIPISARSSGAAAPVRDGVERFAFGLVDVLRWSSYIGDTLIAQAAPDLGSRWLLMPLGACLIELAIQRGIPGVATSRDARQRVAGALAVALTAIFTLPAASPPDLVPASTSVVVLAQLLLARQHAAWVVGELARAAVVIPLVARTGGSVVEIAVIYPAAFNLLVFGLRRFMDRAQTLDDTVLDALGRTALAASAVRGMTLHHDAVDVLLREGTDDPRVREAVAALEAAVRELDAVAVAAGAPNEVVRSGLEAALAVPVIVDGAAAQPAKVGVLVDRITLVELAAVAADERASCAPPGLLGRRRLRALHLRWTANESGAAEIRLRAEPTIASPQPRQVHALEQVADRLGMQVQSTGAELRLVGVAP